MARLPDDLLTLYSDLADRVRTARPHGSTYTRAIGGVDYVYAKIAKAPQRKDVFLGRSDDPETARRIAEIDAASRDARGRRDTIRLLRNAGFAGPDRILGAGLAALADAGMFERGGVLVGTVAYTILQPLVGHKLPATSLMTRDIDIATTSLHLALADDVDVLTILREVDASFAPVPTLDHRVFPYRFRNADGYLVDLLTPARSRDDGETLHLPALAAGAAPLQFLRWLISDPVPAVALWGAGIPVRVPQPARYATHKLIIAQRRNLANRLKRAKDLLQAHALMEALRISDPFALEDAMEDARGQGRGWSDPIERSLAEIAGTA